MSSNLSFTTQRFFQLAVLSLALLLPQGVRADTESYYAPPSQLRASLQLGYSEAFSQDYINLNINALAQFSSATAAFHFNTEKNAISHLRASITAGSLTSSDKDLTWILLKPNGLNINQFDEIILISQPLVVFDKDNKATLDGFLTLRGITVPVQVEAHLNFVQASGFLKSNVFGERGAIGLTLVVNVHCDVFGMQPVDSNNKSRGDIATIKLEMRAIRQ